VPAYGQQDFHLDVQVKTDGRTWKRYGYQDHIYSWMHLLVIPGPFSHDPVEIEDDVVENMLVNFLFELRRDLPELETAPGATSD
jgi:hypothetical protein